MRVGTSNIFLSVGMSGKGGKKLVEVGRSGLGSLNHEKNRAKLLFTQTLFYSNGS